MFIKEQFERDIKVKGKSEPITKKFVEIQKPDGDTVILEVKDGVTKSKGANLLLKRAEKAIELEEKSKSKAKAKAKKKAKKKA